ncbi:MAG: hypothetical protein J6N92_04745 [Alloprevotella sp.]|nr:hypothetical protein [Alloprevotella sp.]
MKKSLLLTLALVVAATAAAQRTFTKVNAEKTLKPTTLMTTKPGMKAARKAMPARFTSEKPTAFYSRPEGLFFYGMDYTGSMGRGAYAYAPVGAPLNMKAVVSAENSKWVYATGIDETGEDYVYAEKEITTADSSLSVTYNDVDWFPAPALLGISKVGESALKAKLDTAAYQTAAALVVGGAPADVYSDQDGNGYPMPATNYAPSVYAGAGGILDDFATNSAEADAVLAGEYGIAAIHTDAFLEFFSFAEGSKAVLNGIDLVVKAGQRNVENYTDETEDLELSDITVQILPLLPGGAIGAPIAELIPTDMEIMPYSDGSGVWGHGFRFEAETPIICEGSFFVLITPANDEAVFAPLAMVTTDVDNPSSCFALCTIQEEEDSEPYQDLVSTSFYWAQDYSMANLATCVGAMLSYDPDDIAAAEEALAGVHTPTQKEQKSGVSYDLTGRRVSATQKGIVIVDGKKVIH